MPLENILVSTAQYFNSWIKRDHTPKETASEPLKDCPPSIPTEILTKGVLIKQKNGILCFITSNKSEHQKSLHFANEKKLDQYLMQNKTIDIWEIEDQRSVVPKTVYKYEIWDNEMATFSSLENLYKKIASTTDHGLFCIQYHNTDDKRYIIQKKGWFQQSYDEVTEKIALQTIVTKETAALRRRKVYAVGILALTATTALTGTKILTKSLEMINVRDGLIDTFPRDSMMKINTLASTLLLTGTMGYVARQPGGASILPVALGALTFLKSAYAQTCLNSTSSFDFSRISDIAVSENYAYVAAESDCLRIMDVNKKNDPVFVGGYYGCNNATNLAVSGSYTYLIDNSGLKIINTSNKAAPTLLGSLNIGEVVTKITVSGNYVYLASDVGGLWIIDATNKAAPAQIGSYLCTTVVVNGVASAVGVSGDGNYCYLACHSEYSGWSTLIILDVNNKASPIYTGSLRYISGKIKDIAVSGNYVYLAADSFLAIDVTNKAAPGQLYEGSSSMSLVISENYAYTPRTKQFYPNYYDSLTIYNITDKANPTWVTTEKLWYIGGQWDVPKTELKGLTISDNFVYLLKNPPWNDDSCLIFDLSCYPPSSRGDNNSWIFYTGGGTFLGLVVVGTTVFCFYKKKKKHRENSIEDGIVIPSAIPSIEPDDTPGTFFAARNSTGDVFLFPSTTRTDRDEKYDKEMDERFERYFGEKMSKYKLQNQALFSQQLKEQELAFSKRIELYQQQINEITAEHQQEFYQKIHDDVLQKYCIENLESETLDLQQKIRLEIQENISYHLQNEMERVLTSQEYQSQVQEMQETILEQLNERQKHLAEEMFLTQKEQLQIKDKQDPLWKEYEIKQRKLLEQQELYANGPVRTFYTTIEKVLGARLVSAITLAAGMVKRKESKTEQVGKLAGGIVEAALNGIPIVGGIVGAIAGYTIETGVGAVKDKFQSKKEETTLDTVIHFKNATTMAELAARRVAQSYQKHIKENYLSSSETEAAGIWAANFMYDFIKEGGLKAVINESSEVKIKVLVDEVYKANLIESSKKGKKRGMFEKLPDLSSDTHPLPGAHDPQRKIGEAVFRLAKSSLASEEDKKNATIRLNGRMKKLLSYHPVFKLQREGKVLKIQCLEESTSSASKKIELLEKLGEHLHELFVQEIVEDWKVDRSENTLLILTGATGRVEQLEDLLSNSDLKFIGYENSASSSSSYERKPTTEISSPPSYEDHMRKEEEPPHYRPIPPVIPPHYNSIPLAIPPHSHHSLPPAIPPHQYSTLE